MTKTKKILSIVLAVAIVFTGIAAIVGNKENKIETKSKGDYLLTSSEDEMGLYSFDENVNASKTLSETVETTKTNESKSDVYIGRKIIRNASITLSTEKYGATISSIEKKVLELNGYIESSEENKYDEYTYTRMTVRVPEESLDKFLESVSGFATVTSKSISSDDVTLTYVDNESHLKALRAEQETLMGLLEKATNLSDVITIQDRLTNVRADIEYYESTLNRLDNEVEYSTVNITVDEVSHESETGEGFWAEILVGLKDSFYDIGEGFKTIFASFIINIPYLVILAIIFVIGYVIIKKIIKKRRSKGGRQTDSGDVPTEE